VKSLLQDCCIFSWRKKATKGSSFFALEKNNKTKKLETESRISFKKKYIFAKISKDEKNYFFACISYFGFVWYKAND
jgi:hypothetical protein